jgi:uncharacterized membrane protein YjdF
MKRIDVFAGFNLALFVVLCASRYYDRFILYIGRDNLSEFFIYAAVILAGIGLLWSVFRRYEFPPVLLIVLQVGILMHFAGAFVLVGEGRLYDVHLAGIRYDKFVHVVNACGAAVLVHRLFQIQGIALTSINAVFLFLVVLGLGAVIEVVEYAVVLTVPGNGVGGYDNNMQDLIANAIGSGGYVLTRLAVARLSQTALRAGQHQRSCQAERA